MALTWLIMCNVFDDLVISWFTILSNSICNFKSMSSIFVSLKTHDCLCFPFHHNLGKVLFVLWCNSMISYVASISKGFLMRALLALFHSKFSGNSSKTKVILVKACVRWWATSKGRKFWFFALGLPLVIDGMNVLLAWSMKESLLCIWEHMQIYEKQIFGFSRMILLSTWWYQCFVWCGPMGWNKTQ